MTDFERDFYHWQRESYEQCMNGGSEMPKREDYDEKGNRIGTKYTSEGKKLDPFLVSMYGMDYAIQEAKK